MDVGQTPQGTVTDEMFQRALQESVQEVDQERQQSVETEFEGKSDFRNAFETTVGAAGLGISKSIFETKDFFMGETPYAEQSEARKDIYERSDYISRNNTVGGIVGDISQFATGLVGVGKVAKPLKALTGAKASGKVARIAAEVAKGAVAGAVVMDPHEDRLSDLIQNYPALENPVSAYLAADPSDSNAEGRFKSALEGIGLDLAIVGVFGASVKALRHFRSGDESGGSKILTDLGDLDKTAQEAVEGVDDRVTRNIDGSNTPSSPLEPSDELAQADVEGRSLAEDVGITPDESISMPQASTAKSVASEIPAQGPDAVPRFDPQIDVTDETISSLSRAFDADTKAINHHGSREAAEEAGHKFSQSETIPWQKMTAEGDAVNYMNRVVEGFQVELDNLKGGAVLKDERVTEMVNQRSQVFNEDPEMLLGMLKQAGENANRLAADMEASYLVSNKALQDSYALAAKIRNGMLDEYGGDVASATEELKRRLIMSIEMVGAARSMTAAAGRSVRRMRGQFGITPEDIQKLKDLPDDRLVEALYQTKGNPKALAKTANKGFIDKVLDNVSFSLVNSLLWLYPTHVVNTTTNLYMLMARPAEKILGSYSLGPKGSPIRQQAMKEYRFMTGALSDGWNSAIEAFRRGDSVMAPHEVEYFRYAETTDNSGEIPWKPVKNIGDLVHNAILAARPKVLIGLPTRSLGAVDEFVKTLRYRGVVGARATMEADDMGLSGAAYQQHIERRMGEAFTENGEALDKASLKEAHTTTFTQELQPKTLGSTMQATVAKHPSMRLILPFVRTPVNVLRYAVKMTPGLNIIQTEYRQMLTGQLGKEAQAQAVGQMSMGGIFMGLAATLAAEGRITGGGPSDNKLKKQLMAHGWKPYSIVWEKDDGTTQYFPIGRFDPVGMAFGMMADLVDIQKFPEKHDTATQGAAAVLVALAKNFSEKTFLLNLNQALQAATDPEKYLSRFVGSTAGNAIPFSSLMRGTNPDPYMREARTLVDHALKSVPGYSETLAPQRDAFGELIPTRKGLSSSSDLDMVEAEHERIILEVGRGITPPSPGRNGIDLRDFELEDGRNAYDVLQEYSGSPKSGMPLKTALSRLIGSKAYGQLADGDASTKGTKLNALSGVVSKYRAAAYKRLLSESDKLRDAIYERQILARGEVLRNKRGQRTNNDTSEMLNSLGIQQ